MPRYFDMTSITPRCRPRRRGGCGGLLRRCITRDPKQRLRDIGEARIALSDTTDAEPLSVNRVFRPNWRVAILLYAAALVLAAAVGAFVVSKRPVPDTRPVRIFDVSDTEGAMHAAIAPDGSKVAYAKADGLWVRQLAKPSADHIVSSTDIGSMAWSPMGDALAFFDGADEVHIVRPDGSERRTAWRAGATPFRADIGLAWSGNALLRAGHPGGSIACRLTPRTRRLSLWLIGTEVRLVHRFPVISGRRPHHSGQPGAERRTIRLRHRVGIPRQ